MTSYLVTGASRGLGLAFVQKLVLLPSTSVVLATARSFTSNIQALGIQHPGKIHLLPLDITNVNQVSALASEVDALLPAGLDVLINNAAVGQAPSSVTEVFVSPVPNVQLAC